ncbi:hypothetical protein RIVM261_016680 [Rivularia sp. IAM M-261]|nr:hypothetical protein RIVM261_016680 [Rivularia sp. IAM M-261]
MKLQRTTLVLMLLALGLGAFVYYYEILGATQRSEVSESQKRIFSFAADDIQSLTITKGNENIILERSGTQSPPKWLLKAPQTSPASNASVSYLTDLLVKGQINRTISSPISQLNEFGLDQPQATIEIKLKNQQTYKLILGKLDFSKNFLYAQINPSSKLDKINVLLVSKDFQNAVNRDISEWTQAGDNPGQSSPLPLPTFNTSSPTPKN